MNTFLENYINQNADADLVNAQRINAQSRGQKVDWGSTILTTLFTSLQEYARSAQARALMAQINQARRNDVPPWPETYNASTVNAAASAEMTRRATPNSSAYDETDPTAKFKAYQISKRRAVPQEWDDVPAAKIDRPSSTLILSSRGCYYEVMVGNTEGPSIYAIDELNRLNQSGPVGPSTYAASTLSPILLTGIEKSQADITSQVPCLNNVKVFYTFGQHFGQVRINGEVLLGPLGDVRTDGVDRITQFFQENRVSVKKKAITITVAGKSDFVYLTNMAVGQVDREYHILPFTFSGVLLDLNNKSALINPDGEVMLSATDLQNEPSLFKALQEDTLAAETEMLNEQIAKELRPAFDAMDKQAKETKEIEDNIDNYMQHLIGLRTDVLAKNADLRDTTRMQDTLRAVAPANPTVKGGAASIQAAEAIVAKRYGAAKDTNTGLLGLTGIKNQAEQAPLVGGLLRTVGQSAQNYGEASVSAGQAWDDLAKSTKTTYTNPMETQVQQYQAAGQATSDALDRAAVAPSAPVSKTATLQGVNPLEIQTKQYQQAGEATAKATKSAWRGAVDASQVE